MTLPPAFFTVHADLPREGPGLPEDVLWALDCAGTPAEARICDAGCGPGGDTVVLAEARPAAEIVAMDTHADFAKAARAVTARFGSRVRVTAGDYRNLEGAFDLIWCAGAAYFVGYPDLLDLWRPHLRPGGAVAFSEPAWMRVPPSAAAHAFWEDYPAIEDVAAHRRTLADLGWDILGQRWVVGAAWEAYYDPMQARIDRLRAGPMDQDLIEAVDESAQEIARWRAASDEIAYALFVVRPG